MLASTSVAIARVKRRWFAAKSMVKRRNASYCASCLIGGNWGETGWEMRGGLGMSKACLLFLGCTCDSSRLHRKIQREEGHWWTRYRCAGQSGAQIARSAFWALVDSQLLACEHSEPSRLDPFLNSQHRDSETEQGPVRHNSEPLMQATNASRKPAANTRQCIACIIARVNSSPSDSSCRILFSSPSSRVCGCLGVSVLTSDLLLMALSGLPAFDRLRVANL